MNKTYAFSDLHGRYDLWQKIKEYIDETDTLIFCGDAIDRGNDGIRLMIELLNSPKVIYLRGNHEQMMLNGMKEYYSTEFYDSDMMLWICNGGQYTFNKFITFPREQQDNILLKLSHLPYYTYYHQILLNHSGFPIFDKDIKDKKILDNILWNREHIQEQDNLSNRIVVHGHTPVQYITNDIEYNKILKYGHKIDIDLGCFESNKTCLLDLDTLEPIYFEI